MRHYHHMVNFNATPSVEFTEWCMYGELSDMDIASIRRANLKRFIETMLAGNQSVLAARMDVQPSYINDLLRPSAKGKSKSFGEKTARNIEIALGVDRMALDRPTTETQAPHSATVTQLHEGQWPFSVSRASFDRLSDADKTTIRAVMADLVKRNEANRGRRGKGSPKS